MTDNQLKLEALKLAIDMARETMFARRTEVENAWSHRVMEVSYPKLPTIDTEEVVKNFAILMQALGRQ